MKLLDLFCCAGGAGMGYHRAGFDVTGVDIDPQSRYPFEFHQGDALKYLLEHHHEFDAFHASPPCQAHTNAQKIRGNDHPDFIVAVRSAFKLIGKPWIIENVPGAPLENPIELCGCMFPGLGTYRPRLFESNISLSRRSFVTLTRHGRPRWAGRRSRASSCTSSATSPAWRRRSGPWASTGCRVTNSAKLFLRPTPSSSAAS